MASALLSRILLPVHHQLTAPVDVPLKVLRAHVVVRLALADWADAAEVGGHVLLEAAEGEDAGLAVGADLHPFPHGVHEPAQHGTQP